MHSSVAEAWPALAREHEGVFAWPYLDHRGNVTVGIGLLIESAGKPTEECFRLPWTIDGRPATRVQIAAGWEAVNARYEIAGKARAFEMVSRLRLDDQTIDAALAAKTREFWSILTAQLPDLEEWPADAQLALIDCAYQAGPYFLTLVKWSQLSDAAHSSDFDRCAEYCANPNASTTRNARRAHLFTNAAWVVDLGIDPGILWDRATPEQEDDMPLSDEDLAKIVAAVKPLIPTPTDIARKVLTLDGQIENKDIHPTGGDHVTLATAVEFIAEKVS